jgi:hypothetical protein
MANETVKVITQREDGVWEVRDAAGEVAELCGGNKPGAEWFLWALWAEARKQTALLKAATASLEYLERVIDNQPDHVPALEKATASLDTVAARLSDVVETLDYFDKEGVSIRKASK